MWIFGYGSLMFDGWEAACGCIDRKWANLPGYRRSFNKKSVESRGTRATPGLTLNLARAEGEICRGIAFAFEDNDQTQKILRGLEKREACKPRALRVQLEEGKEVTAQVFIYEGHNLIGSMPVPGKADMVVKAAGIRGTNFDYVKDTYEGLKGVGVDDPAVTALWEAVRKRHLAGFAPILSSDNCHYRICCFSGTAGAGRDSAVPSRLKHSRLPRYSNQTICLKSAHYWDSNALSPATCNRIQGNFDSFFDAQLNLCCSRRRTR